MNALPDGSSPAPDVPTPWRLVARAVETHDVVTLTVAPLHGMAPSFEPGQFAMIGVGSLGDVPISIASHPANRATWAFTLRRAGAVTHALADDRVGDVITVRGPFGVPWDLARAAGRHALVIAGGLGLAPLRSAILRLASARSPAHSRPAEVTVLAGARTPDDLLYRAWLEELAGVVDVRTAVDAAPGGFAGPHRIGFVTDLIAEHVSDPDAVEAFVCGPDVMMNTAIRSLGDIGVTPSQVEVTLERNMQCGTGSCGHCQLGPLLVCRDGPVVTGDRLADLLERSEL